MISNFIGCNVNDVIALFSCLLACGRMPCSNLLFLGNVHKASFLRNNKRVQVDYTFRWAKVELQSIKILFDLRIDWTLPALF